MTIKTKQELLAIFEENGVNVVKKGNILQVRSTTENPTIEISPLFVESNSESILQLFQDTVIRRRQTATFEQESIFLFQKMNPESVAYNIKMCFEINQGWTAEMVWNATKDIIIESPSLSLNFEVVSGKVSVNAGKAILKPFNTITAGNEDEAREAIHGFSMAFDLEKDILVRGSIIRTPDKTLARIDVHHIVFDGKSTYFFKNRLFDILNGGPKPAVRENGSGIVIFSKPPVSNGIVVPLENTHFPYSELVKTRFNRPSKTLFLSFPRGLSDAILQSAKSKKVTVYTLLLSIYILYLRSLGNLRPLVGTYIDCREPESENIIGMFARLVPVYLDNPGEISFLGFVKHVEAEFNRCSSDARRSFDYSDRSELVSTINNVFSFHRIPRQRTEGTSQFVKNRNSKFDLEFSFLHKGDDLEMYVEYDNSKLDGSRVAEMARNLKSMLSGLSGPLEPVISSQFLNRFNLGLYGGTLARMKGAPKERPTDFLETITNRTKLHPDRIAIVHLNETLTYGGLSVKIGALAERIRIRMGSGKVAIVSMEKSIRFIVSILAVLKSGNTFIPVNHRTPKNRTKRILDESGASLLIHDSGFDGGFSPEIMLDVESPGYTSGEIVSATPSHISYVIYTSGSTGEPKGVAISNSSLSAFLASAIERLSMNECDSFLSITEIGFDICYLELLAPLMVGARIRIEKVEDMLLGENFMKVIAADGTTFFQSTPSLMKEILKTGWPGNKDINLLCGGEALPPNLAKELVAKSGTLWHMYGPTESTIWTHISELRESEPIYIKNPLPNTFAYVADAAGNLVPPGVLGQLHLGGPQLSEGYWGSGGPTKSPFIDSVVFPGETVFATGDMVTYNESGDIRYVGRMDSQVKFKGNRIELGEIEKCILEIPSIEDCKVILDRDGKSRIIAFVISANFDEAVIRNGLIDDLPGYMIPGRIFPVKSFPKNNNGKICVDGLLKLANDFASNSKPKGNPKELEILLEEFINLEIIDSSRTFFDMGGDSFEGVRFISSVKDRFNITLSLADLALYTIDQIRTKMQRQ